MQSLCQAWLNTSTHQTAYTYFRHTPQHSLGNGPPGSHPCPSRREGSFFPSAWAPEVSGDTPGNPPAFCRCSDLWQDQRKDHPGGVTFREGGVSAGQETLQCTVATGLSGTCLPKHPKLVRIVLAPNSSRSASADTGDCAQGSPTQHNPVFMTNRLLLAAPNPAPSQLCHVGVGTCSQVGQWHLTGQNPRRQFNRASPRSWPPSSGHPTCQAWSQEADPGEGQMEGLWPLQAALL